MRSDNVKTGMQQAPHRSLFNALGLTKEELERPLVGIVCSYNEIVPGHMNLDKIANAVKMGDYAYDGGDGIKLLDWLVENKRFYPIRLHTMNPVGRENMLRMIWRYW